MKQRNLFIMGLPEAGKTTFLAAFWHVINNCPDVCMKSYKLTTDQSYLADISSRWAEATKLDRTKRSSEKFDLDLELMDKSGQIINLNFPDLSGESFQNQWEYREISKEHAKKAQLATGVLLFIHPDKIVEEQLISGLDASMMEEAPPESTPGTTKKEWTHKDSPAQVQLVEILQFLSFIRGCNLLKIAIIISAWDLVIDCQGSKLKPEEWIKQRVPLLWQYMKANKEIYSFTYYGISAQGGELNDASRLLDFDNPYDRIVVVDMHGNKSNDITTPIKWILNND